MKNNTSSSKTWPRNIVLVFIILALGDAVIVYLATQSSVPSMDENPYQASLSFEQIALARQSASRDGVSADINLDRQQFQASLRGLSSNSPTSFQVRLAHAQDASQDRLLSIDSPNASVSTKFDPLRPGTWIVQLSAKTAEKSYYFESHLLVE